MDEFNDDNLHRRQMFCEIMTPRINQPEFLLEKLLSLSDNTLCLFPLI